MNYWLALGSVYNWHTAFEHGNIWGLKETQRRFWESINEGDALLFYATSPVSGVIGYGIVRTKVKQTKPLWPDELKRHKVIWPLRLEFDVEWCLPKEEWQAKRIVSQTILPRAGFQSVSKDIAEEIISGFEFSGFKTQSIKEEPVKYETTAADVKDTPFSHENVQKQLIEIGKLQKFIAETEYPFDLGKIDVVWRRVTNSVPTYAFEIQVGGDVYHALAKLKHAYDLWNSHIFIVASEKDKEKAFALLSGTFHEIGERVTFVELDRIEELYKRKKAYFDLEKELGITT